MMIYRSGRFGLVFSFCFLLSVFRNGILSAAPRDSVNIFQEKARIALRNQPRISLAFAEKALKAGKKSPPATGLVSHEIMAEALIRLSEPDQAVSHLFEALELSSGANLADGRVRCLILMGRLNWILEDAPKALYYFGEAAKEGRKAGKYQLQLLAEAYAAYLRIQSAPPGEDADYLKISELFSYVSVGQPDTILLAQASNLMGNAAFFHKSDPDLAIRYYRQAVSLCRQLGDVYQEAVFSQNLAEMLITKGSLPAAEEILNNNLRLARQYGYDMLIISNLKLLSGCAAKRIEYRKAYDLQNAYEDLRSRYLNESRQRRTDAILQEYIRKRKDLQLREQEQARAAAVLEAEKKLRYYQVVVLASLMAFLLLTAFVFFNRSRVRRIKKQQELAELQNRELEILNEKLLQQSASADKSREIAEAALQAKADFLSVITHELRTPIHAVIASAHLLEETEEPEKQRKNLEILRFSAENLYGLINNVLDFNKIESGNIELEPRPFSLRELLEGIQLSFTPRAGEKGLELVFRVDRNLPDAFLGDRLRLGQILGNLLSNAIKFTHKGRVSMEVLYFRNHSEGNLSIAVRDTGIGMTPEETQRVFGFFSQANPGISVRYGGSGLGIPITSRLLQLMGSRLHIQSEPGKGSRFYFQLQLPETDSIFLGKAGASIPGTSFSRRRILFVEDVDYNRILAQRFFDKWQISYDMAASGKEAIALASLHEYDLILMDIRLPDGSGFEVSSAIRKMPGAGHSPILAMTASDRSEIDEEMKLAGMQDFLGKPFSPEDLRLALQKWLGKRVNSAEL